MAKQCFTPGNRLLLCRRTSFIVFRLLSISSEEEMTYGKNQAISIHIGGICSGNSMGELFKTTRSGKRECQESKGCRDVSGRR